MPPGCAPAARVSPPSPGGPPAARGDDRRRTHQRELDPLARLEERPELLLLPRERLRHHVLRLALGRQAPHGHLRRLLRPLRHLAGAKRRLKRAILAGSETGDLHAHFLARQALFTPKVLDRDAYVAQIDAISVADVKAFVTKAIQAGPTLVSEGSSANYKPVSKLF